MLNWAKSTRLRLGLDIRFIVTGPLWIFCTKKAKSQTAAQQTMMHVEGFYAQSGTIVD